MATAVAVVGGMLAGMAISAAVFLYAQKRWF